MSGWRTRLAGPLLATVSLLVTALLLAGIEAGLRVAGIGAASEARASRLAYQHVWPPLLRPALRPDGTPILRTSDPRLPYQTLLAEKPVDGLRVFVLGGSAAAGLGFGPNAAFSRELERLLRLAHPDRSVEVVNLGIVALAARQVAVILEEVCRDHDADLVLVYSGNNEFLEIHAERYAEAHATLASRLTGRLAGTHLFRLLRDAAARMRGPAALEESEAAGGERRIPESVLIRDMALRPDEIEAVEVRYGDTLDRMAETAGRSGTRLALMTVASNWKWRGRDDLPPDWMDGLAPPGGGDPAERLRRVREALDARLEASPAAERSDLLFRRATAAEAAGDFAAARRDYRAAMNSDPHLRRALDGMAERVRQIARREELPLVDVIEDLARRAQHGIPGFGEFYDYVHFTPRGAVLVAASAYRALAAASALPAAADFDLERAVGARLAFLEGLEQDPFERGEWLGFGFERAGIHDRDLWKYERLREELDARVEADPHDVRALVYRGNLHSFRVDGAARAAADYARALELSEGDPAIRANLQGLREERAP